MKSRRAFLQLGALSLAATRIGFSSTTPLSPGMSVAIIRDPHDANAFAPAVKWAIQELGTALEKHNFKVRQVNSLAQLTARDLGIFATGYTSLRMPILGKDSVETLKSSEAFALVPTTHGPSPVLVAVG